MVGLTTNRSRTESEIPLHLLPHAVARKVKEWGDAMYRISVKRTHWHHYNITVRTKPVPKELLPLEVALPDPDMPEDIRKRSRKSGRCAV